MPESILAVTDSISSQDANVRYEYVACFSTVPPGEISSVLSVAKACHITQKDASKKDAPPRENTYLIWKNKK